MGLPRTHAHHHALMASRCDLRVMSHSPIFQLPNKPLPTLLKPEAMVLDASDSAVKTLAVCTVLLYLKFVITARLQAVNTFMAGGRPPEDRKLAELTRKDNPGPEQNFAQMGDVPADESLREAIERSERWKRIVANDVESIPLALIVFTMGIFVNSNKTVHIIAIIAFTVLRIMHTYAYANSIQPHRSFIWLGSVLFVLIGGGNVIAGVASN